MDTQWIEINLPWAQADRKIAAKVERLRKQASRLYSKAFAKAEATMGQTLVQARGLLNEARLAQYLKRHPGHTKDDMLWTDGLEQMDQVRKKYPVLQVNEPGQQPDPCDATWLVHAKQVCRRSPLGTALAEFEHYRWQRWFLAGQAPENSKAEVLEREALGMTQVSVFHSILGDHDLCRPGVLLEVRTQTGETKQLLIGHLGVHGGPDQWEQDPQVIEDHDVVLRAKVVWEPA